MRALIKKIRQLLKDKRFRKIWYRGVSSTAAVVVFITTYALVLPAITMESEASCGIPAHQHSTDCYEEQLICGLEESDGHHHTDDCYTVTKELKCTIPEHQHDETCFDEDGNLTCSQAEHTHDSTCYEERLELTCGLEESEGHHHDSSCYKQVLTCGLEAHIHSVECYKEDSKAVTASTSIQASDDFDGAVAATAASTSVPAETYEPENASNGSNSSAAGTTSKMTTDDADSTDAFEAANASTAFDENSSTAELSSAAATTGVLPEPVEQEDLSEGYVPTLDPVNMDQVLDKHTGFYYYHAGEGEELPASSTEITSWKKVDDNTELAPTDLVKAYFAYTIPAGTLNETNQVARYRLPSNLHLTDDQIIAINQQENGIAASYIDYDTLQILDTDNYHKYLGAEAIEGTRTPDQNLTDGTQEYISAVVKAENVYDDEGIYGEKGAYLGQDLIFVFTPYSIEKNQNEYDQDGQPVKAGEKIAGWFACDFNTAQVEWVESGSAEPVEEIAADSETGAVVRRAEKTAKVVFVEKDTEASTKEISQKLTMVEETADNTSDAETEASTEDAVADGTDANAIDANAAVEDQTGGTDAATSATDETTEEVSTATTEAPAEGEEQPVEYTSGTLTASGDTYRITLDYTADAEIPADAKLNVREITADSDPEAYEVCLEQAKEQVASGENKDTGKVTVDKAATRFFDIEIVAPVISVDHSVDDKSKENDVDDTTVETDTPADGEAADIEPNSDGATSDDVGSTGSAGDIESFGNEENKGNTDKSEPSSTIDNNDTNTTTEPTEPTESVEKWEKIEPAAPVAVNIQLIETAKTVNAADTAKTVSEMEEKTQIQGTTVADPTILHFAEDGVETIESTTEVASSTVEEEKATTGDREVMSEGAEGNETTAIQFETSSFSIYGVVYTSTITTTFLTASGETYEITVTYDADTEIPEGSELHVSEILPKDEKYAEYLKAAMETAIGSAMDDYTLSDNYARFFDIEIRANGQEVEPKAPVLVKVELADAPKEEKLTVVHFDTTESADNTSDDIPVPVVMDAEVGEDIRFETDSFSVYGVIVAPAPTGVDDLDGRTFTISRDGRYATNTITDINTGTANGLGKTTTESQATVWQFEQVDGAAYRIFTMDSGTKQYLKFTKSTADVNRAHVSLVAEEANASVFTVSQDGNAYRFSTLADGTTYYLDEHNGNSGNGFAGWNGQTPNGTLTLNFTQPALQNNTSYMMLVKYDGKYYIVNNDGSLTEVVYNQATQEVRVDDPMEWEIEQNGSDGHIYYHHKHTGFTDQQIASDYFRMYIDPSVGNALTEETADNVTVTHDATHTANGVTWEQNHIEHPSGRQTVLNQTALSVSPVSGDETYTISHGDAYLGLAFEDGVPVRVVGNKGQGDAAEFVFAQPHVNNADHLKNTVNHIDISIAGNASVSVPLAYGNYYGPEGDAGEPIKVVSSDTKLLLTEAQMPDQRQVRITTEDIKRATITATRLDTGEEVDNAFYITGYSGNVTTPYSGDQVRIEGSFLVSDLRGTEYETIDGARYDGTQYSWPDSDYVNAVHRARKNNIIEYTVTVTKPLTYNLIDPDVGQLYDEEGNPITVTVDVAFSASFNYWDDENASNGGNECPPLQPDYFYTETWKQGGIPNHNMSGMDFVLGGDAENPDSPLVALEITKVIMDEAGNRIELKTPVYNYFDIYENKNATNTIGGDDDKNSVQGLHVIDDNNHPEWEEDTRDGSWLTDENYKLWKTKRLKIDESGSALIYDFNATNAMYYIVERHDAESLPRTVTDKDGNIWYYEKTYIETEYARRDESPFSYDEYSNKTTHPNAMHITDEYSDENESYASIPEVAGNFLMLNGHAKKEGFLEFYVYNIYTKKKGSVSFTKTDADGQGLGGAVFTLFQSYENGILSDPLRTDRIVEAASTAGTGVVDFQNVPVGTYYMRETAAPAGHKKSDTVYKVVIEDDDDSTKTSLITHIDGTPLVDNEIENEEGEPGSVVFNKTDSGNQILFGAEFTLYRISTCEAGTELKNGDNNVTAVSDASGIVTFSGIPTGNYYMKETAAPSNDYVANTKRYFVHIAENGSSDTSFIAEQEARPALNGRTEEAYYREKAVGNVVNYKADELVIRKQWRDFYGHSIEPDADSISLTLKRIKHTSQAIPKTINVTVNTNVSGQNYSQTRKTFTNVITDSVQISWYDDGQFNWSAGRLPAPSVQGLTFVDGYTASQHGHGDEQQYKDAKWTVSGLGSYPQNTVNITFTYDVANDQYCNGDYFRNVINNSEISMTSIGDGGGTGSSEEDVGTIILSSVGNWTASRNIQGTEDDIENNTLAATDESGNVYLYFIEETSIPSGYTVSYSASNTGIQSGTLTAYNKKGLADVTIVKMDGDDRVTPLGNAVFELTAINGESNGVQSLVPEVKRTGYTETTGVAVFQNIAAGYYEIREKTPPEGYLPNPDAVFYIKVTDREVVRIEKNDDLPPSQWRQAANDDIVTFSAGTATVYNEKPMSITILKVDANSTDTKLGEATFRLTKVQAIDSVNQVIEDQYDRTGTTDNEGETKGRLVFTKLTPGYYYLEEIEPPAGYVKTEKGWHFQVDENGIVANVGDFSPNGTIRYVNKKNVTVTNEPGVELPSTGGPGTRLIYLLGGMLTLAAGLLLLGRNRFKS